ncbi:MAG: hypothetical protein HDR32_01795 [Treponema sp.]|nr:hypothetical protein [Treponema sp.]
MKRFFAILLSAAMLISASLFASCATKEEAFLSAPTGVNVISTSSSSVKVSWNFVSGATRYYVYKSEYSSSSTASDVGSTNLTSMTVTGLRANTKYYFWVKASDGTTISDYSLFGSATPTLSAPTGLIATAASSSQVNLYWNSVSGATTYYVYKSEDSSSSTASVISSTASTSTTVTGLKPNTEYYFWVTASDDTATSSYSSSARTRTTATPSAPIGVTATTISSSSVRVSWNSVSSATGYTVYKSEDESSSTAFLVGGTTSTSMVVTGLKASTKYYFWVKASDGSSASDYSLPSYATTGKATTSDSSSEFASLKIVNSSSHIIWPTVRLYTASDIANKVPNAHITTKIILLAGSSNLNFLKSGASGTYAIAPGTYVKISSDPPTIGRRDYKISAFRDIVITKGNTTTVVITDNDFIYDF